MKRTLLLIFAAAAVLTLPLRAAVYNVRDFGARGDGITIDSPAINSAIEKAAGEGGGVVCLPAGRYASYSIHLASHIELRLEKGAVLAAAEGLGFDLAEPGPQPQFQDFGHSHWKNSLIWGIGLEDITISGEGMIDGTNLSGGYGDTAVREGVANKAISLKECRNVVLRDITIYRGGHFCLLATGVDNMRILGVVADTNRDAFDIDCCRNVIVSNCIVNSPHDDGIVLKASYALGGFKDTEDVSITNCNISGYEVGTVLDGSYLHVTNPINPHSGKPLTNRAGGRIKFGTESSGGFKNISVSNCTMHYCGGLFLESVDGGVLENVTISNITIHECTDCPIYFRLATRMRSPEGTPVGAIRRVLISDVTSYDSNSVYGLQITGVPGHSIEDVTLRNLHMNFKGGFGPEDAVNPVPEKENGYPDPWLFGTSAGWDGSKPVVMPSKGLFLRHVKGIVIDGLHFSFNSPDSRELIVSEDATDVICRDLTLDGKLLKN